jgi:UDP-N-acetylmuramoyl-L-alanyl-D-glutamate--2,6-diaminopimelate ligase
MDVELSSATADSRRVGQGSLFAAIPGTQFDGHDFISSAFEAGAPAVLLRDWPQGGSWPGDRVGLQVRDPRRALALSAHLLQREPSSSLRSVGITGTNGKTSTVAILRPILEAAGMASGALGTTGIEWTEGGRNVHHEATHTTPEGPELYAWLARMRDAGVQAVALELSSHALAQGRAAGLQLDVAAWTNLSRDHLDFHGDMAAYEAAKALIFGEWLARWGKPNCSAVINLDDPAVARHLPDHPVALTFSCEPASEADVAPEAPPEFSIDGCRVRVRTPAGSFELSTQLLGVHNLANALTATACALALGIDTGPIAAGLTTARGAPGRLERVSVANRGPRVLVDYAHSAEAIAEVIAALRPLVAGRLIVLFGCGGDRDAGKRPLMARATAGADFVVLTSDNPRSEDPEAILDDAEQGFNPASPPHLRIRDRAEAIAAAIAEAGPDDVVLLAGKGHETHQDLGDQRIDFDDRRVAAAVLEEL